MGKTKDSSRATSPAGIGKVLKRLHYPLDVILLCVRWCVVLAEPAQPRRNDGRAGN